MAERIAEVTETLQKTLPIGILCFGTFGNILSLTVLTRPKARRFSTAVFLITLTIVDFIAMWSGLLRIIITGYLKKDIRDVSSVTCKIHVFLVYTSTHISSWLIVAVTVERVVCVWMPVKTYLGRDNKRALIVTCLIIFTFISLDLHLLVGFDLKPLTFGYSNVTILICKPAISVGYIKFVDKIWPWIDMSLLFLIPFCVIIFGNILIVVRVYISKKVRRDRFPDTYRRSSDSNSLYFLTALLVTLNVVFVLCVAPITVFTIGQYTWWPDVIYTEKELAISWLCWVTVNISLYMNHAVNFILYLTCGTKFREELKKMVSCFGFVHVNNRQKVQITRSISRSGTGSISHIPTTDILSAC